MEKYQVLTEIFKSGIWGRHMVQEIASHDGEGGERIKRGTESIE